MAERMENLFETEEEESGMPSDFYRLYKEELKAVVPCSPEELKTLSEAVLKGDKAAGKRLVEGNLMMAASVAEEYAGQGLPMGDLVQEANMALLLVAESFSGKDFKAEAEAAIRAAIEDALNSQDMELKIEEEIAARVNVLNDIAAGMARELGREATVEELSERMKMTTDEIRDIMKLALDAVDVSKE